MDISFEGLSINSAVRILPTFDGSSIAYIWNEVKFKDIQNAIKIKIPAKKEPIKKAEVVLLCKE
ncbi:hypothetical protein [Leptospira yanagawae]|uniref:hypothetical protein n=1 Tax=Leptospira yanagawae TaxID=293069 RepID=UPI0012EBF57C|nr:hypothetical protein [Leptospira yanagawae]